MPDAAKVQEVVHAQMDILWDAVALLECALAHPDMQDNQEGPQRLVRMAAERLRTLDDVLSPLV